MRAIAVLALLVATARDTAAQSTAARSPLDRELRERALVAALRVRAERFSDSALVDGGSLLVGEVPYPHDPELGTRIGMALGNGGIEVRHSYQWTDPFAQGHPRRTQLRLEHASREGAAVKLRFYAYRAGERWWEQVTLHADTVAKTAAVMRFERVRHERFVARRIPAPASTVDPHLREAVVTTVIAQEWEETGHLGNDSIGVIVWTPSWKPASGFWPASASRWLERVMRAYGIRADTAGKRMRATVGFADIAQHGDSASAQVSFGFGTWCEPRRQYLGGDVQYIYTFFHDEAGWHYAARVAVGHGDSLGCPEPPRRGTLR